MAVKNAGEINHSNEDEMLLDTALVNALLWSKSSRNKAIALLKQENKAGNNKAATRENKAVPQERGSVMSDEFWDDFVLMSKVCLLRNKEADIYDVFETIRTKLLGAWGYEASFLAKVDAEVEAEYQKELARGLR